MLPINKIIKTDCVKGLRTLPDECIQCVVTSPPYWGLRDYGIKDQLGMEDIPEQYIQQLLVVFEEVKRVLRPDGTLWLNLGDCYWGSGKAGKDPLYQKHHTAFGKVMEDARKFGKPTTGKHPEYKSKDLIGLPWMLAFALRNQGWYLRQDIIWHKPNGVPEPVKDRCTKTHEYIFLLTKSKKYYFDYKSIQIPTSAKNLHDKTSRVSVKGFDSKLVNCFRKPGGPYEMVNKRSVWTITTKAFKGDHPAVFPPEIPELCIMAGSKEGDVILDPFMGSGTTAMVAKKLGRKFIGFELNTGYIKLANERLEG